MSAPPTPPSQSWQEAQGASGSPASGSVRLFSFAGRGRGDGLLFPLADDRAKQPNSVHPPLGRSAPNPARKPTLDVFSQLCKQETNFRIFSISAARRIKGCGFHSPPSLWGQAVACEAGPRKTGARAFYPHMQNECKRKKPKHCTSSEVHVRGCRHGGGRKQRVTPQSQAGLVPSTLGFFLISKRVFRALDSAIPPLPPKDQE